MDESAIFDRLAETTNNMYTGLLKVQKARYQDQLAQQLKDFETDLNTLIEEHQSYYQGEEIGKYLHKLKNIRNDLTELQENIGSHYKICVRGNGKAGKSTLLNALLSINDTTGSKIGVLPTTRTIDTYSDEMVIDEAIVKQVDSEGRAKETRVCRDNAIIIKKNEEALFDAKYKECERLIQERTKGIFLDSVIRDVKKDIWESNLRKSDIREYRWGIGENDFFHNLLLIDTPGLDQEPNYKEVIEDVNHYGIDGVLWVVEQSRMQGDAVKKALEEDIVKLESVYKGGYAFVVINMEDTEEGYRGSELWSRVERRAKKQLGDKFQDVICVNARLAYQGGIEGNHDKVRKSNIEELRYKINSLFVDNRSEQFIEREETRINNLLEACLKVIREYIESLNTCRRKYMLNKVKIENEYKKAIIDWSMISEKILKQYYTEMTARVRSKASQIADYRNLSDAEFSLLKKELIVADSFATRINQELQRLIYIYRESYKGLQKDVVFSKFENQEYAWRRYSGSYSLVAYKPKALSEYVSIDNDLAGKITAFIDSVAGKDSVLYKVTRFMADAFKAPSDRLIDDIKKVMKTEVQNIDMKQYLQEYEKICFYTLNQSYMNHCGKDEELGDLIRVLERFTDNRPKIHIEEVALEEILERTI